MPLGTHSWTVAKETYKGIVTPWRKLFDYKAPPYSTYPNGNAQSNNYGTISIVQYHFSGLEPEDILMTETSGATEEATRTANEVPVTGLASGPAILTRPGDTAARHTCVYGAGRRPWLQFISEWYLLFLHASYSLIFTLGMVHVLDGQHFTISDNSIKTLGFVSDGRLTQTAVTTLVSACLVLAKILSASWQSRGMAVCVHST